MQTKTNSIVVMQIFRNLKKYIYNPKLCCESIPIGMNQLRNVSSSTVFDNTAITSPENRIKCIGKMQKAPQIRLSGGNISVKQAAVLIPLVTCENGQLGLLYTKRSAKLSNHVRQVAFPGGIRDPTDRSESDCALRETEEEIGLPRDRVDVWGTGRLIMPRDGPTIMPVIGIVRDFQMDQLKLNPDEVDEAFIVPLQQLCSGSCKRYTQYRTGYSIPVYVCEKERIWGITAVITNLFLAALLSRDVYKPYIKYISNYKII